MVPGTWYALPRVEERFNVNNTHTLVRTSTAVALLVRTCYEGSNDMGIIHVNPIPIVCGTENMTEGEKGSSCLVHRLQRFTFYCLVLPGTGPGTGMILVLVLVLALHLHVWIFFVRTDQS